MNTKFKSLNKQALKKIKGGDDTAVGELASYCSMGLPYNCKVCTAHSTDGSNIDRTFGDYSYDLVDSWASAWRAFGYRVKCHIWVYT